MCLKCRKTRINSFSFERTDNLCRDQFAFAFCASLFISQGVKLRFKDMYMVSFDVCAMKHQALLWSVTPKLSHMDTSDHIETHSQCTVFQHALSVLCHILTQISIFS